MATHYEVDVQSSTVFVTVTGTLTVDDIAEYARKLRNDPQFDPSFSELADLTELKSGNVTYADFNEISMTIDPYSPASKRAFVAIPGTTPYGLGRMYQAIGSNAGRDIQLFGSLGEAKRWLGLAA
jgi:hypothetical protein